MNVEIICPLYNAENEVIKLHQSLLMQKNVKIGKLSYILTESSDNTEVLLKQNNIDFSTVSKDDFSHSLTREKIAMKSHCDILVFISQDVEIRDEYWLHNLILPIITGEVAASFSRQISKHNNIEKYVREKNYPKNSFILSKEDVKKIGLKAFFISDVSSAIKTSVYQQLNGYDQKKLVVSEDMYIAYKIIMNGYKIKYCADSVVYHSHKLTLKQLYKRYYNIGVFLGENSYLEKYGIVKSGGGVAFYVLKKAILHFNIPVLFRFIPDMLTRWFGMRNGKKSKLK